MTVVDPKRRDGRIGSFLGLGRDGQWVTANGGRGGGSVVVLKWLCPLVWVVAVSVWPNPVLTPQDRGARAQELIARGRASIGPVDTVKALSMTGSRRMALGPEDPWLPYEVHIVLPDKCLRLMSSMMMPGPRVVRTALGLNGSSVIDRRLDLASGTVAPKSMTNLVRERAVFTRLMLQWLLRVPPFMQLSLSYAGETDGPDGRRALQIDITGPGWPATRLLLDKDSCRPVQITYHVDRMIAPGVPAGPAEDEYCVELSDVRLVGQMRLPFRAAARLNGRLVEEVRVKEYVLNRPKMTTEMFRFR